MTYIVCAEVKATSLIRSLQRHVRPAIGRMQTAVGDCVVLTCGGKDGLHYILRAPSCVHHFPGYVAFFIIISFLCKNWAQFHGSAYRVILRLRPMGAPH